MGYTNETTHYGIPLPLGSDKTTPMDYNTSAQEVDTILFEAKTDSASALQKANQLQQDLATTNGNVTAVTGRVTTLEGTVTTQGHSILQNTQDISDVRADALDMIVAKDEGTAQVATVAVAEGEYFRYNDVLYIATQAIAVGDTIVPNTNCKATNVGTELNQLNNDLSDSVAVESSNVNLTLKTNEANIITRSGGLSTVVVGFTITDVIAPASELFNIPESMLKRATGTEDIYLPCIYYTSGNPTPMMLHLNAETGKVYRTTAFSAEGELLISATFPNNY